MSGDRRHRKVHLLAGLACCRSTAAAAYAQAVARAADRLAREGVDLVLEPINRRDMPGYFLTTSPLPGV